ncbi:MAG TPA: hypothetical protein PLK94_00235 [Alphaproteobacteria bacterium]|nr:hypothetical protein [Alphaproteobacteria bacterium]
MSKRLQKGQIAPGIASKKKKHASSLRAIHRELLSAIEDPAQADKRIIEACQSQAALAKLHIPEKNIFPMSLGTLKSHAEELFDNGGFNYLKKCIEKAKKSFENLKNNNDERKNIDCEVKSTRGSKKYLVEKNNKLQENVTRNYNLIAEFSDQYSNLLSICLTFIKSPNPNHKSFEKNIIKHIDQYKECPQKWKVIKGGKN